jgi:hypothetical protein
MPALTSDDVRLSAIHFLLNGPRVLEKRGSLSGFGYLWNRSRSAATAHAASFDGEIAILLPLRNWSVLDLGRCRRTPSFLNWIDPLETWVRNDNLVHLSQVNSPGRKKAEKATVKAALRLISSYELLLKVGTMARSISRVISRRSRTSVTPNTR